MTCRCASNPLAILEMQPGWWQGAAATRRQFQAEAEAAGHKREADEHARMASEYERKALNPPKLPGAVLVNLRSAGL